MKKLLKIICLKIHKKILICYKGTQMKKIFLLISLCFFNYGFAQEASSQIDVLKNIKGITAYNATIIGYGMYCNFPKDEVQLINAQFIAILNQVKLSSKDYDDTKSYFFDTLKTAKERGPSNSNMSCSQFQTEFDKIYNTIKSQNK